MGKKMVPADIRRRFDAASHVLVRIQNTVRDVVLNCCEKFGYAYLGRTKSLDSIAEKVETGRFSAWSEIDDLFGCTIVVPAQSHEDSVLEYLQKEFHQHGLKRRGQVNQDPEVFRFGATRFIGTLRPGPVGENELSRIHFEVQIRTAFEHAWSVAVHDLSYKSDKIDWKLERLAAQLKASVEQLDALVSTYERAAETLVEHPWPAIQVQQKILEHFRGLVETGKIPRENKPSSWGRFAKNIYALVSNSNLQGSFAKLKREERFPQIMEMCTDEIEARGCPRTISVFQFVLGTLIERDFIQTFRDGYFPFVTGDLETFFPKTVNFTSRFNLEK